ncbi:small glutamine-rich tetratricopeptide repeat-containing protein beta [Condylostylus longicornis]|uniref:small glutamine-rich tetratricopeptide repeat-containing protein beta n=1 Tax=Condylostylus longicornis TaxID=2530218 RepID=UPI00244DFB95|nr:small glutamine-rich tetratricopeptide repeat-containing protein beta [Condylostylus longicornis]
MIDEIKKSFASKFINFLKQQIQEQTLPSDGLESLEVAIQCLEAAFELHPDDQIEDENAENNTATSTSNNKKFNPIDLFELYQTACLETSPNRGEIAEQIKDNGNRLMKEGKFQEAFLQYNRAITYDPTNPVFYSNRAAAFIRLGQYDKAIGDCKMALVYNPDYGKAYGRMGIAYSNLNKFEEARAAYQKALELEPDNQDYQNNLRVAEERITANTATNPSITNIQSFLSSVQASEGGENNFENMFSNPANLTNLFGDMLRDPVITSALHSLADNPQGILDMSRQVAAAISAENPNLMRDVQDTLMNALRRNRNNETIENNANQSNDTSNNEKRNNEGK